MVAAAAVVVVVAAAGGSGGGEGGWLLPVMPGKTQSIGEACALKQGIVDPKP